MGLMLATIWVHLGYSTNKLNDRLSVSFFSVAFLAFVSRPLLSVRYGRGADAVPQMSVAGIPAFLEVRSCVVLVGTFSFR